MSDVLTYHKPENLASKHYHWTRLHFRSQRTPNVWGPFHRPNNSSTLVVAAVVLVCDQVSILRRRISQHVLRVDESTTVDVLPDSRSVHYDLPSDGTVFVGGLPAATDRRATSGLRGGGPQTPPSPIGRHRQSHLLPGQQRAVMAPPPYLHKQIRSRGLGFQGCLGSIDLNGDLWRLSERRDDVPVEHRDDVVRGCHGTFAVSCLLTSFTRYLRQGVYVFMGVCLFVSRITQKLLDRFSQNSAKRRHMGIRRNRWILVVIRITLGLWLRLGGAETHPAKYAACVEVCYAAFI